MTAELLAAGPDPAARVLVLYNEPVLAPDHPDLDSEHEVLYTVAAVERNLAEAGYTVSRLGVARDPAPLVSLLRQEPPDVVFNLFEGLGDFGNSEASVAGLLEWFGIPFTGCP